MQVIALSTLESYINEKYVRTTLIITARVPRKIKWLYKTLR